MMRSAIRRLEQVQIEFVTLGARTPAAEFEPDPDALQAFIASQENELRTLYEARSSLYNMPEQVRARNVRRRCIARGCVHDLRAVGPLQISLPSAGAGGRNLDNCNGSAVRGYGIHRQGRYLFDQGPDVH